MSRIIVVTGCESRNDSDEDDQQVGLRVRSALPETMMGGPVEIVRIANQLMARGSNSEAVRFSVASPPVQVASYALRKGARHAAIAHVAAQFTSSTEVVIAHSLGSVAAYEALHLATQPIPHFITLGSPLGLPAVSYGHLDLPRSTKRPRWPLVVQRWTNLRSRRDPFAIRGLQTLFEAGSNIEEHTVNSFGRNPHRLTGYLESTEFITALRSVRNSMPS
ncbi:hypothetical protein GCM10009853_032190 [Glycomyces scopariae]